MDDLLPSLRAVLETTPERWIALTETLPRTLLDRAPAPAEWSAIDCLRHLLQTEQLVFPARMQAFLGGAERLPAFDPNAALVDAGGAVPETPVAIAAAFAGLRREALAALEQVREEDLGRAAEHEELGRVTLGELLHEWAAHDLMHTVQAERALMQPFIAGTGPWRGNFTDHDVAAR